MKGIITICLLAFAQLVAFSQTAGIQIKWGDLGSDKAFKPTSSFSIVGMLNNMVCIAKTSNGKNWTYAYYDERMQLVKEHSKEMAFAGWQKEYSINGLYFVNDNAYQIYIENDFKENGSVSTYFAELDMATLKQKEKTMVGTRYPNKAYQWWYMGYYIRQSADKSKFAFVANGREYLIDIEGKESHDFEVIVYDSQLNKIQRQTWNYPFAASKIDIANIVVDDLGNVLVQANIKFKSNEGKKSTGKGLETAVIGFPLNRQPQYLVIDCLEDNLNTTFLTPTRNGRIIASGFYSSKKSGESAKGHFFMVYNINTNKLERKIFQPFSTKLKSGFSDGLKNEEIEQLYLYAVEATAGGGIVLIGEQETSGSTMTGQNQSQSYGNSRDIVVISLDANGKVLLETNIPKNQRANDAGRSGGNMFTNGYYSFVYSFDGQNLRFLFNDNIKNIANFDPAKTVECKNHAQATATVAELDIATGKYTKQILFTAKEEGVMLFPKASIAVASNKFVIFAGDKGTTNINSFRIGEVTFN